MILVYVIGLLSCGSLNTLISKYQFSTYAVGSEAVLKAFDKPCFGTLSMFIGMSLVYPLRGFVGVKHDSKTESLIESTPQSITKDALLVLIPTCLDLIASWLCLFGLISTCASVWQILRGSMLIFSAIFSVVLLNRKITRVQWAGILICVAAITIVGLAESSGNLTPYV